MVEKEVKLLLDENDYFALLAQFEWHERLVQVNHYYVDNLYALVREKISVRVRSVNNCLFLQIKQPIHIDDALHIKEEYEESIASIPSIITSDKLHSVTGQCFGNAFLIGHLETTRHIFKLSDSVTLFLDKNLYLGKVDYEVEIEFSDDEFDLTEFLLRFRIKSHRGAQGKYSRFMALARS